MNRIITVLFTAFIFLTSCKQKQVKTEISTLDTGGIAVGPYLTHDNKGNAVLCWSEKYGRDSLYHIRYASYNEQTNTFNSPVTVPASSGISTSAESMSKVAFKADGTIIAVYSKRFPNEKNPYAGAIYYSSSTDNGKTWSASQFLHSDTTHNYGRSFFDITTLKDGEIAAVWLDGRYGKRIKGSALFFARTTKGKGFGIDTCLEKGTCECCRTDILSDKEGNIHLAYRNITFPTGLSDKQVRDMGYKMSADYGKTFSAVKTISNDNWQIDGCPHSGPSIAVTKDGVNAVWFTAGGGSGIYGASSSMSKGFNKRTLITAEGRHPQLISLLNDQLIMVCEELKDEPEEKPMEMKHSHGGMAMNNGPVANSKIVLKSLTSPTEDKAISITDGQHADHHPVITSLNKGTLIAWVREKDGRSEVCYTNMNID
nr:sialidase family protein [Pedobacter panaciterrae]